jgi:hypothetical protein
MRELTEKIAPKLSQQDEIYALGLADAASEFFGEEVGDFVRGESILSTKSAELLLAGLRSGVIGRTEVLSPGAVQNVVNIASNMLAVARANSTSPDSQLEKELTFAVANLDQDERARLDMIVQEITQRSIARILERMASIDRVL